MLTVSLLPDKFVRPDKVPLDSAVFPVEVPSMNEFAELLITHHVAPGVFLEEVRQNSRLQRIQLLSFDFDNGTTVESVLEKIDYWRHVVAASQHHLIDKHGQGIQQRFHLFLYQNRPSWSAAEYTATVLAAKARFGFNDADPNCCDAARYFFRHREILSVKDCQTPEERSRQRFDESEIRNSLIIPQRPQKQYRTTRLEVSVTDKVLKSTKYADLLLYGLSTPGRRHDSCIRLLGAMNQMGFERSDAESVILAHAATDSSFTLREIKRMVAYIWR